MTKQYIGDGVYVEVENGMLKLTTKRAGGPLFYEDTIFMERPVFAEFVKYAKAYELECFERRQPIE
jgi:hypothetical protein